MAFDPENNPSVHIRESEIADIAALEKQTAGVDVVEQVEYVLAAKQSEGVEDLRRIAKEADNWAERLADIENEVAEAYGLGYTTLPISRKEFVKLSNFLSKDVAKLVKLPSPTVTETEEVMMSGIGENVSGRGGR